MEVITLYGMTNGQPVMIWQRYPCADYDADKEEAISSCSQWLNDRQFSPFVVRLEDCEIEEGSVVKINEVLIEEYLQ